MAQPLASTDWERFAAEVRRYHLSVRREDDPPLISAEPRTSVQPHVWPWTDIEQLLQQACELVELGGATGSERRGLRLVNPGLPYGSTHTLWGTVQAVMPGEVAAAHRHTPAALRFIIRGRGAWTTVDGERYPMNKGDFVITPAWAWHDHQNLGDEMAVWLDVLDIPLVRALHCEFFEPFPQPAQPVVAGGNPSLRRYGSGVLRPAGEAGRGVTGAVPVYPYEQAYAALKALAELEPDPFDDVILEYVNPTHGGHVMPTIACYIQLLRPGVRTAAHRHTHSVLYHVVAGEGRTQVGERTLEWREGDFFALPPWAPHAHTNLRPDREAVLFSVTDRPVYEALGLHREEAAGGR